MVNNTARFRIGTALFISLLIVLWSASAGEEAVLAVEKILARVAVHDFHPLNKDDSFTMDRGLKRHGIARLEDDDWKVRLLAVRDLVRVPQAKAGGIVNGLAHKDKHVRHLCAMALGIRRENAAVANLEKVIREDASALVRSQAVIAIGQMVSSNSVELLRDRLKHDPSRDVRHQCELAIDQITKRMGASKAQLAAFRSLDESTFESVQLGKPAPDFALQDTNGKEWRLSDFRGNHPVVLIWVFADWCPVCHGEFRDLIESRDAFRAAGVKVFTLECHDRYRCRVMVGRELAPRYWFSKKPFKELYTEKIWWPHLLDQAGAIGAKYGVDPMTFAVHAEYINRPTTVIVDKAGIVRFAYYGTFWGDRPTIKQTLEMVRSGRYTFEHSQRLKPVAESGRTRRLEATLDSAPQPQRSIQEN